MLEDLVDLARETSSEKRRELLGRMTDHFVEGAEDYSQQELVLFGEVISKLLQKADVQSRSVLSEKISGNANTPRDVTLKLANDEIRVARPVLENSPNLTTKDLLTLVEKKGTEYRLAISHRADLNEEVTDELIEHGETEVLQSISGNLSAHISDKGFGTLAKHEKGSEEIRGNLSGRQDMSVNAAKNVLPYLAPQEQQKLLGLIEDGQGELLALVDEAVRETYIANMATIKKRIDAKILLNNVRTGVRTLDSVLTRLAKEDRPKDCAMLLAKLSKIPESQVNSNMLKVNGEGIALLCKAMEVGREAFYELAIMRYARLKLPKSKADELALAYEDIDVEAAQRTLRFVSVRNTITPKSSAA